LLETLDKCNNICLDVLNKFRFFQKATGNFPLPISTVYVHIDILYQQNILVLFVFHMT